MKPLALVIFFVIGSTVLAADPKPEERRMADLAVGKYKASVLSAQRAYEKSIADAQAELGKDYDKAINGAMRRGASGLELANILLSEKKAKLSEATGRDSGDDLFAPTRQELVKILATGTWFVFSDKPNRDHPAQFIDNGNGTVTERGRGTWAVERRWLLHGPDHVLLPVDDGRFRGIHLPDGNTFNMFRDPK